jgi:hypothetical protein
MIAAPAPRATPSAPRRMPEHHAQARYRAFRLQGELGPRRGSGAGAAVRDQARHDAPFAQYPAALQDHLQAALERGVDDAARRALLTCLAAPGRQATPELVLRDLLGVLRRAAFDAKDAMRCCAWLDLAPVARLGRVARRLFLEADLRLAADGPWRRLAAALARTEGLVAMAEGAQADLLRYAAGPLPGPGAAPERGTVLQAAWGGRRDALRALLEGRAFRRARPTLQAELLQDFLHDPSREVWVLQASALTGHAVVVLGDPADPASLAYGRRWVRTSAGRVQARLSCPDPTVRAGWRRPAIDGVTRYAADRYALSRQGELQLVGWLEATYGAMFGQERPAGPLPGHGAPTRFAGAAEDALRFFSGHAPARAVMVAGRVQEDLQNTDESSAALLAAYLSA